MNLVVVGQILSAVSDYRMSITVGIVIISIVGYFISLFGFKLVHTWEKYSWILTFILFLVLIGKAAPHVMPDTPGSDPGLTGVGNWLSIFAINFSNGSGWSSITSDYYCNYPARTNKWLLFALTWFGIVIPTSFSVIIGACLGNAAINYNGTYAPYADAYENHSMGGLVYTVLGNGAFARFCLIVFTFSVLGNNIANTYSSGLSLQLLGHWFHAVPRLVWSLLYTVVVMVLGIAGQENLSAVISDFVSLLGVSTSRKPIFPHKKLMRSTVLDSLLHSHPPPRRQMVPPLRRLQPASLEQTLHASPRCCRSLLASRGLPWRWCPRYVAGVVRWACCARFRR